MIPREYPEEERITPSMTGQGQRQQQPSPAPTTTPDQYRTMDGEITRAIQQDNGSYAIEEYIGDGQFSIKGNVTESSPEYTEAQRWAKAHPEAQFHTPEGIAATNQKMYDFALGSGIVQKGTPIFTSDDFGGPKAVNPYQTTTTAQKIDPGASTEVEDIASKMSRQPVPIVTMNYTRGNIDVAAVNPWTPEEYDPTADLSKLPVATDWFGAPIPGAYYDPARDKVLWDMPGKQLEDAASVGFFVDNTTGRDIYDEVNKGITPVKNPEDFVSDIIGGTPASKQPRSSWITQTNEIGIPNSIAANPISKSNNANRVQNNQSANAIAVGLGFDAALRGSGVLPFASNLAKVGNWFSGKVDEVANKKYDIDDPVLSSVTRGILDVPVMLSTFPEALINAGRTTTVTAVTNPEAIPGLAIVGGAAFVKGNVDAATSDPIRYLTSGAVLGAGVGKLIPPGTVKGAVGRAAGKVSEVTGFDKAMADIGVKDIVGAIKGAPGQPGPIRSRLSAAADVFGKDADVKNIYKSSLELERNLANIEPGKMDTLSLANVKQASPYTNIIENALKDEPHSVFGGATMESQFVKRTPRTTMDVDVMVADPSKTAIRMKDLIGPEVDVEGGLVLGAGKGPHIIDAHAAPEGYPLRGAIGKAGAEIDIDGAIQGRGTKWLGEPVQAAIPGKRQVYVKDGLQQERLDFGGTRKAAATMFDTLNLEKKGYRLPKDFYDFMNIGMERIAVQKERVGKMNPVARALWNRRIGKAQTQIDRLMGSTFRYKESKTGPWVTKTGRDIFDMFEAKEAKPQSVIGGSENMVIRLTSPPSGNNGVFGAISEKASRTYRRSSTTMSAAASSKIYTPGLDKSFVPSAKSHAGSSVRSTAKSPGSNSVFSLIGGSSVVTSKRSQPSVVNKSSKVSSPSSIDIISTTPSIIGEKSISPSPTPKSSRPSPSSPSPNVRSPSIVPNIPSGISSIIGGSKPNKNSRRLKVHFPGEETTKKQSKRGKRSRRVEWDYPVEKVLSGIGIGNVSSKKSKKSKSSRRSSKYDPLKLINAKMRL